MRWNVPGESVDIKNEMKTRMTEVISVLFLGFDLKFSMPSSRILKTMNSVENNIKIAANDSDALPMYSEAKTISAGR